MATFSTSSPSTRETLRSRRHREGMRFTLIELLIIVAIITILASLFMPSMTLAKRQARLLQCESNLRQIGIGLLSYCGDYNEYAPACYPNGCLNGGDVKTTWVYLLYNSIESKKTFSLSYYWNPSIGPKWALCPEKTLAWPYTKTDPRYHYYFWGGPWGGPYGNCSYPANYLVTPPYGDYRISVIKQPAQTLCMTDHTFNGVDHNPPGNHAGGNAGILLFDGHTTKSKQLGAYWDSRPFADYTYDQGWH